MINTVSGRWVGILLFSEQVSNWKFLSVLIEQICSSCSQWRKYKLEKVKISASGVVKEDLFYGDCLKLLLTLRFLQKNMLKYWDIPNLLKPRRLSEPAILNKYVQTIKLPSAGDCSKDGTVCLISGLRNISANYSDTFWAKDSFIVHIMTYKL